ncbi:class I SAM-dependent methyltransferase [Riemerella columbina]|uniref:class I SAM-dependent methyltransferase n=1 Tax=Riemerella columbina TaxID=103810 RepID=UPI00266F945A|nr:class I SAM-dependent methyltransferase [Riemerella columbina]WKS94811.1 RsmD family RNA methyltransferase [Riemerella columbina]
MKESLLLPKVQKFISENLDVQLPDLLFKKPIFEEVSNQDLAIQIQGRKTAQKKFPAFNQEYILFPPKLNLEQTSSQATAEYKSQGLSGRAFLDLTCGFGIDAFFLSQHFETVTLVEQNRQLLDLVAHNWQQLGRKANFIDQDLMQFLNDAPQHFDLIYLDPARRDAHKKKVFLLEDLSPNVLEIQEKLLEKSPKVLMKLSPLIDLKYLCTVLKNIARIDIIAVKNEVKEIVVLQNLETSKPNIEGRCVNLETSEPVFHFTINDEPSGAINYAAPRRYLYIPNNAILKSGAYAKLAAQYQLEKLHPNTHFFTSEVLIDHFPGRILEVKILEAKQIKKKSTYNIISKNHPLSPAEIKKKYQLKDGGDRYLIFTQTLNGKIILEGIQKK